MQDNQSNDLQPLKILQDIQSPTNQKKKGMERKEKKRREKKRKKRTISLLLKVNRVGSLWWLIVIHDSQPGDRGSKRREKREREGEKREGEGKEGEGKGERKKEREKG